LDFQEATKETGSEALHELAVEPVALQLELSEMVPPQK
jgi:hypothetical protein